MARSQSTAMVGTDLALLGMIFLVLIVLSGLARHPLDDRDPFRPRVVQVLACRGSGEGAVSSSDTPRSARLWAPLRLRQRHL